MIKYKIVLVPFPFDDLSDSKVRPAVCLTEPVGEFNHIIIAFISSKIPDTVLNSDLVVRKGDEGFTQTGLSVASVIRLHKMVTIPSYLIKRELGSLSESIIQKIKLKIKDLF